MVPGSLSEVGRIRRVVLKHARHAFAGPDAIAVEWHGLNFQAPPDFHRALDEYDAFLEIVSSTGAQLDFLPAARGAGLDSIYVRDASVVAPAGLVLARMGKRQREPEPAAQGVAFQQWGLAQHGAILHDRIPADVTVAAEDRFAYARALTDPRIRPDNGALHDGVLLDVALPPDDAVRTDHTVGRQNDSRRHG